VQRLYSPPAPSEEIDDPAGRLPSAMRPASPKLNFLDASRAVLLYLSGCAVLWCIWHSGINPNQQWVEWVSMNVFLLLTFPLLFRAIFLDDALSAYGMAWGDKRKTLWWSVGLLVAVLPLLVYASRGPEYQAFYPQLAGARYSAAAFGVLCVTTAAYMFAWEYFFRGFLLFGLAKGFGAPAAIFLQAIPFGLSHTGKVPTEMYASFGAAVILGWVSWRCRSFVPSFVVHTAANLLFNALVIHATGTWL